MALLFSNPAAAQGALAWSDVVVQARKNHPDLVSAREKVNQSKADKVITQSAFFPQVSGETDAGRSRSASTGAHTDAYSYGVSASQLLFDGFKTAFDVQSAVKNIEASEYGYAVTSSNVRLDLRTSFVNLLRAQELLKITENIARRRKQSRDLIHLRYEAGREHRGSLLTAEANLAQADFEVEQARRNITLSQRRLLTRMGSADFLGIRVLGELDTSDLDRVKPDLKNLALETPFLRQLVVLKEAAKWGVQSSQANFFPQIYARAGTGKSGATWPPEGREWLMGVSLSVPLFEGGNNVAELTRSKAFLGQTQAEEKSGLNSILFTLEEAWASLQDAIDQVGVQAKFLEAALEREKIAESEYSTGLVSFNDWIIIEDNLVRAEKSYLDSKAAALIAQANWVQAKGETLDNE